MSALRALSRTRLAEPTACGSLWVEVNGTLCALRCSGALWLPDTATLVAGDLHLEKGSAYAARGQLLPPYDTSDTLRRLEAEVEALSPATLVLLGDSFHDASALARMAPRDLARVADLTRGRRLVWAEGNHDLALLADIASTLPGETAEEVRVEGLILRHEPRLPCEAGEVAGHLHPAVGLGVGRGARRRCFVTDGRRLLLPAFGAYAGGLSVRDPAIAGLFSTPPICGALGERRVHPVPWSAARG